MRISLSECEKFEQEYALTLLRKARLLAVLAREAVALFTWEMDLA